MRAATRLLLPLIVLALAVPACSKADSAPPVATVSVAFSKDRVAIGSPLDIQYRFVVAPDARIDGDYRVFVHVLDDRGQQMWTDDHDPPVPTSKWRPGETIEYTRTRFIPSFPFLGQATVVAGLYRDNERLPLQGLDPADRESTSREYVVGHLDILAQVENVALWRKSGWHPVEFSPTDTALDWEWTEKVATLSFKNPRKDITFFLEYDARPDVFPDRPQTVTVSVGGKPVYTFAADQTELTLHRIQIAAPDLGDGDMVEMQIEVDKTFVPAQTGGGARDTRELGIRVYHTFVEVR
ncbi:MAG: hypothetical protein R2752_19675 [Vicinamibacterales bacterium]